MLHPLLAQLGKTALHEAAVKGNTEMVAYMMEQVNPNVDARDLVSGICSMCPIAFYIMSGQTVPVCSIEDSSHVEWL